MTRKEAIEILKNAAFLATTTSYQSIEEAVKMAVVALEQQEPCGDAVSRQAAIDAADRADCTELAIKDVKKVTDEVIKELKQLPSAQPEQTDCEYCHEDSDWCVRPIEKNSHAVIFGSVLYLKVKGWSGKVQIKFCPMCGRRL